MKIGATLPQNEIGNDPGAIRAFAQAIEGLGYDDLLLPEHVLGGNPATYPDLGAYYHLPWHEPFVVLSFMAGVTTTLTFCTAVLVAPQRQTALMAKQAAELDVLSGGRLRLGVGVGRNTVEFEALDMDYHNRGKRLEEQVEVMRALWTQDYVTYKGQWHNIADAGLNPRPIQQPIPIWMGGASDPVLKRIGRMADGWLPTTAAANLVEQWETVKAAAVEAGRNPKDIGLQPRLNIKTVKEEDWRSWAEGKRDLGADRVVMYTMNCGLKNVDEHIERYSRFMETVKDLQG
jgi:probable F420-dependent oxidoreductase